MANLTLEDLAKRAKVSPKTISRVVNKLPGVGAQKRAEIEALIRETGFRLNFGARGLASARSYIVCMLVEEQTSHYYFSELQIGISRACIEAGYHLIVEPVGEVMGKGTDAVAARFAGLHPDGFIVVPPVAEDEDFLNALVELKMPFVRVAPVTNKAISSYVDMDDQQATYDLTRQVIDAGHRDLAWLAVSRSLASMQVREAGFKRALADAGIALRPDYDIPVPATQMYVLENALMLLSVADRPTAIVCGNDSMAFIAMAAAQRLGLSVPRDVSVVGFDDSPGSESCWPPLTTIHQPISIIGERATRLLFRQLDRDRPFSGFVTDQVDYAIITRQSVAPPAAKKKTAREQEL